MLAKKVFHQPLAWVKPELETTIKNARNVLELLSDDLGSSELIEQLRNELYLLKGSLEILDFYGAALLVEDMQKACLALKNKSCRQEDETYEALLEGTLALESYIDKLHKDQTDIPVALLPILNDIRASIDEPLLSESALFLPNLSIVPKTPGDVSEDEGKESRLQQSAKSLRPYYQAALLSWYRNPSDKLSIQQMKLVARNLESACFTPRNRQIWWIMGGIFEALADKGLKSNISVRLLLGQGDRIIKSFSNHELNYYEKSPPYNLLKNALYYISQASSEGERVTTLKQVYQLDKVIPTEKDLSELRTQLKGPNSDTLQAIAKELRKILTQSKATIENFVRNTPNKTERLLQTIIPLKHVADTLSILSLSREKQLLQEQIVKIGKIVELEQQPDKEVMMSIASAIIQIESGLQHIGSPFRRSSDKSNLSLEDENTMSNDRKSSTGNLPDTEYRYLATKAILEAKSNLTDMKNAILSFISSGCNESDLLKDIPELLSEIKGCLQMLNNDYASKIIDGLLNCVTTELLNVETSKIDVNFDLLAETIVSMDYYLEALSEERDSTEQLLNLARESLEELGYKVEQPKPETKIPTLEAVVTHISEAPARIKVNANALSEIDAGVTPQQESSITKSGDTEDNVVEFTPEAPDEEVAEIFAEEAKEELQKLETLLATLKLDISDNETLSNMHRVYHTLKGSGKIAGAIHISDFSSTIEEYLNRVLFGAVKPSDEGMKLLSDANSLIHELISCFQNRTTPPQLFNELTQTAIALMATKTESVESSKLTDAQREEKTEEHAESHVEAIENKPLLPVEEIVSVLQESYKQLALMQKYISERSSMQDISPIPEYISDAIRSLHKCAQVTDVSEFIQTTDLLTKYIGNLVRKSAPVNSETLDILSEFCATTKEILLELPNMLNAPQVDSEQYATVDVSLPSDNTSIENQGESTINMREFNAFTEDPGNAEVTNNVVTIDPQSPLNVTAEEEKVEVIEESETPKTEAVENISESIIEAESEQKPEKIEFDDEDLDLIDIFIEETEELIAKGNSLIEDNDLSVADDSVVAAVQRLLHTMKGSARMAGATSVANLTHTFENLAEAIHLKNLEYPSNFETLLQNTLDAVNDMIDDIRSGSDIRVHENLLEKINETLNPKEIIEAEVLEHSEVELTSEETETPEEAISEITQEENDSPQTTENQIEPIEESSSNQEAVPIFTEIETVEAEDQETEMQPVSHITLVEETTDKQVQEDIDSKPTIATELAPEISEVVTESTNKKSESLKVNSGLIDKIVELANDEGSINNRLEDHVATVKTNLLELDKAISRALSQMRDLQFNTSRTQELSQQLSKDNDLNLTQFSETQKIALRMMESIGDIENLHSVITKVTLETDNLLQQQKKAHTDMYENLLNTRLVNFSIQSQRMQRIVRQTCQTLDKKAGLNLEGTDGSIDRVLLESVMGSIEHILRNAISHGIETPETRKTASKNDTGKINIKFSKDQSQHVIEIQDDGAGINPEIIKEKAISKGLISQGAELTEEQTMQLIFAPGFSTSESVDQISGRGVGMNVVLTDIEALGGSVSVESTIGAGSTFTIRLPFTVSRNKTLLVRSQSSTYAIPTNALVQTIPMSQAKLESLYVDANPIFEFEEQDYPLWYVESLLNRSAVTLPNKHQNAYLLILKYQHKRLALQVDEIVETRESVLKSANPQISKIKGLAGTTILGDGKVVLMLDIPALFSLAEEQANVPNQIIYPKEEEKETDTIKALVVDDSITVRKVTERFLNRNTITTKTARDGLEALDVLKDYAPDVILLDIEMPNMDGLEFARRIKANEKLAHIPVIMITSRTGQQHRQAASEIGVNVFLGKPYQESELLGYIQALTGKRLRNA